MQIIQSIRDKGAAAVITVIALSLIGFILMDAQQGGSKLFAGSTSNVGKVNGASVDITEFNNKVKEAEDQEEQRSGQRPTGARIYQIRDQIWDQIVAERIFTEEAHKLGIDLFTPEELSALLLSNDPSNPLLQEKTLVDPATGRLDIPKAQQALNNMKKATGNQKEMIQQQIIKPITLNTKVSRYSAMMSASAFYPTWMQKKDNESNKKFAVISYVSIPYTDIPDNSVKVTDEDINKYVAKHKDLFKQDAGRTLTYYTFSQKPVAEDSLRFRKIVEELKPSFVADTNNTAFVARNSTNVDFKDTYVPKSKIQSSALDSIVTLPLGSVYGPYLDNGSYVLAKYLGSKTMPDSVKARHILITTTDRNTGQQIRDDSTAKKLADSLLAATMSGADFGLLAMQYSADGSKDKGGDLGTFAYGAMVPEFNDFCFNKPAGSKGVVQTQFGYHVIDITMQKEFNPAYKIAFVSKEILASEATINAASLSATKASAMKTSKALAEYATKNNIPAVSNPAVIKQSDYMVGGLQDARQLVRWAFEAKAGDVSEPMSIGDDFIVATLDKVVEEGVQDAKMARPGCESIIRNEKKSEIIIKKIGENATLQSAATAYGKTVAEAGADSSITLSSQIINTIGLESKLIGASFCKDFQTKASAPFAGTNGVYVVKVNSIGSKPEDGADFMQQQTLQKITSLRGQMNGWYEGLKKIADISDNRSTLY